MTAKPPSVSPPGKVKASTLPRRNPQASLSSTSLATSHSSPYGALGPAMSTSSLSRPPRPMSLALFPPRARSITTANSLANSPSSPTRPSPRLTRSPSVSGALTLPSNLPLREGSTVPRRARNVLTWEVACQASPPPLLTTTTGTDPIPDPLVKECSTLRSQLAQVTQDNAHLRDQLLQMEQQVLALQGQLHDVASHQLPKIPDIDLSDHQGIDTSFTPPVHPYRDASSWNDGSTTEEDRGAISFYDYADGEDNAEEEDDDDMDGGAEVNYVESKMDDLWAQIAALESDLVIHQPPSASTSRSQPQPLSTSSPILQGKGDSLQVPSFDLDTSTSASTLLPPALASSSSSVYSSGSTSLITSEEDRQWVRGRGKEDDADEDMAQIGEEEEDHHWVRERSKRDHVEEDMVHLGEEEGEEDEYASFQGSSLSFLDLDVENQANSQDPDQVEQFFRAKSLFEMHSAAPEDSVDGARWACIPDDEFARMMMSSSDHEEDHEEEVEGIEEYDEEEGPSDQMVEDRVIRQIGEEMNQLEIHGEGLLFDIDEYDDEAKALRKALRTQEQTLQALAMEETEVEERTAVLRVKLAAAIKACGRWKGRGNVGQGYERRREGLEEALALEDRILSRIHQQVQEGRETAENLRANWEDVRSQLETAKEAHGLLETTLVHLQRTYHGRVRAQRRARMAVDEQHRQLRGWQDGYDVMRQLDAVGH
ncbi:hypothetical protein BJ684DRAFT_19412 [Piptocephalis cylindrospora]|uniref:Uncharacterized protein n=1 Tax=Piptocephalis cylindrospora TaxID=1907219 RepID=A0A4P9Y590_9FUNG|nr:hypothetical protein BJ684DRAFT_19412 [Piptocephalis cylindrospora]|eukprot:RKP14166.1 hypothetical protein BJ684DRAFT_19412 [Piptocephalis cylindrospora]